MIRSFRDRETELIWNGVRSRKLPGDIQVRGDKTTKYSVVNDVVQIAQRQGMRKVGFISLQEN